MGQVNPLKVKGNPMGVSKAQPGLVARDVQESLGAFPPALPSPPHGQSSHLLPLISSPVGQLDAELSYLPRDL